MSQSERGRSYENLLNNIFFEFVQNTKNSSVPSASIAAIEKQVGLEGLTKLEGENFQSLSVKLLEKEFLPNESRYSILYIGAVGSAKLYSQDLEKFQSKEIPEKTLTASHAKARAIYISFSEFQNEIKNDGKTVAGWIDAFKKGKTVQKRIEETKGYIEAYFSQEQKRARMSLLS